MNNRVKFLQTEEDKKLRKIQEGRKRASAMRIEGERKRKITSELAKKRYYEV